MSPLDIFFAETVRFIRGGGYVERIELNILDFGILTFFNLKKNDNINLSENL